MDPIHSYLVEARKIKVRLARFTVLNDELYKRGFSLPYLKCLRFDEAEYVLWESDEGLCGNHSGPRSLVGKAVREGYFLPTMQNDAAEVIQRCDKCHRFGNVQHIPAELVTSCSFLLH